jgi:RNA 2',3'-cyclic 3'-phosphodiesterase
LTRSERRPRWPGADLPGRRLFIAVPLPVEATARIATLVEEVRADGVPGGGRDVRWVRLDGLHLTLRFLGPTLDDSLGPAAEAVRTAAAVNAPFDISIGGAGTFPPVGRPRALWLGLRQGEDELSEVAAAVDRALTHAGWDLDTKPFRPHLTLARSDGVPAGAAVGARLVAAAADLDVRFRAERIGLFESLTGGGPARYEPLEIAALG